MATVSKDLADTMIANNGVYPGDEHLPPCVRIIEYTNSFGSGQSYGLEYKGQEGKYSASQFVINPKVYWERPTE